MKIKFKYLLLENLFLKNAHFEKVGVLFVPSSRTMVFVVKADIIKFIEKIVMSRNYKFHNPEGLYFGSFAPAQANLGPKVGHTIRDPKAFSE
ncbi:hypothetical protein TPENAI_61167 [Tenacibaculum litopenaei]|uniref:hypothetical protein n=1 Tax=Tenacibaculum litopenaei TaxID=396016 RepID=UPI003893D357